MQKTRIPWVIGPNGDRGYSWNPLTGCMGPKGDGIRCSVGGQVYCFAHGLANGRLRSRYLDNPHVIAGDGADPFAVRWWDERLLEPRDRRKPSGIFVSSMGELWGPWGEIDLTPGWREPCRAQEMVLYQMRSNPRHRFYILTKYPQNLAKHNPWPSNVWVGATATDMEAFKNTCAELQHVQAAVKYLSLEPLLSWAGNRWATGYLELAGVSWVIIGAMSGRLAKAHCPRREWVEDILATADRAGIAVFVKPEIAKLWPDLERRE